jgi:hypothetical protein
MKILYVDLTHKFVLLSLLLRTLFTILNIIINELKYPALLGIQDKVKEFE